MSIFYEIEFAKYILPYPFTINQHHKWKKDESWFQIQAMLLRLIYHGIQGLKK